MTRLVNEPPSLAGWALAEFAALNADRVTAVRGGAVRARRSTAGQVAMVTGGGPGRFPAFAGRAASALPKSHARTPQSPYDTVRRGGAGRREAISRPAAVRSGVGLQTPLLPGWG